MESAISQAREHLSTLPDDWDDNGGTKVPDCTLRFMEVVLRGLGKIPVPTISAGPGLTVDLHWRGSSLDLLINVTPKAEISFYGQRDRREGTQFIKGKEPLHLPFWKWKLKPFFR